MKKILLGILLGIILLIGIVMYVSATNTSATSPGTMEDSNAVGTVAWTVPNNAKVEDGNTAQLIGINFTSHYLKASNFGFSIPNGAIINGILVEVKKNQVINGNYYKDSEVKIIKADNTIGSTNKAITGSYWNNTLSYYSYGSSSDLWGETWDDTKINDGDFGVVLSAVLTGTSITAYIDHIRITIYYTESGGGVQGSQVRIVGANNHLRVSGTNNHLNIRNYTG